ncbi:MAG: hypothetical protein JXB04_12855, partial [Kiritimatiellae bacterium]|nr:hypothetical protein [Kiritimatiellia bacterium]
MKLSQRVVAMAAIGVLGWVRMGTDADAFPGDPPGGYESWTEEQREDWRKSVDSLHSSFEQVEQRRRERGTYMHEHGMTEDEAAAYQTYKDYRKAREEIYTLRGGARDEHSEASDPVYEGAGLYGASQYKAGASKNVNAAEQRASDLYQDCKRMEQDWKARGYDKTFGTLADSDRYPIKKTDGSRTDVVEANLFNKRLDPADAKFTDFVRDRPEDLRQLIKDLPPSDLKNQLEQQWAAGDNRRLVETLKSMQEVGLVSTLKNDDGTYSNITLDYGKAWGRPKYSENDTWDKIGDPGPEAEGAEAPDKEAAGAAKGSEGAAPEGEGEAKTGETPPPEGVVNDAGQTVSSEGQEYIKQDGDGVPVGGEDGDKATGGEAGPDLAEGAEAKEGEGAAGGRSRGGADKPGTDVAEDGDKEGADTEREEGAAEGGEAGQATGVETADTEPVEPTPTGYMGDGKPYWGDGSKSKPFTDSWWNYPDIKDGEAKSDGDVGDGSGAGGSLLDGFMNGKSSKSDSHARSSYEGMESAADLNDASRAGDAAAHQANQILDKAGYDAGKIGADSAASAAKGDRDQSWGQAMGDAVEGAFTQGGEALGSGFGGAAAGEVSGDLFGGGSPGRDDGGDKGEAGDQGAQV